MNQPLAKNQSSYLFNARLLPSNELILRLSSKNHKIGDNDENRQNKFIARELEQFLLINKNSNLLENNLETSEALQDGWLRQFQKQSKKEKIGYGIAPSPRGFSKKVKNKIRWLVSAMDKEYRRDQLLFCTFTLPASTYDAMQKLSAYSSYTVDRFNRMCSIAFKKNSYMRVNVWELQKRGALHLHLVIGSDDAKGLEGVRVKFKKQCQRILNDISEKSGIDMWGRSDGSTWKNNQDVLQADAQYVKKSVGAYMSKYLSKVATKGNKKGLSFTPVRWCTYTRNAPKILARHTVNIEGKRLSGKDAIEMFKEIESMAQYISNTSYNKPLIYKDKIGEAWNMRIIMKDDRELQDSIMNIIKEALLKYDAVSSPFVTERLILVGEEFEVEREKMWMNDAIAVIREENDIKYQFKRDRMMRKMAIEARVLKGVRDENTG